MASSVAETPAAHDDDRLEPHSPQRTNRNGVRVAFSKSAESGVMEKAGAISPGDSTASSGQLDSIPSRLQHLIHRDHPKTEIDKPPAIKHHFPHKYMIRRPRALQFSYKGKTLEAGDYLSHVERLSHEELEALTPADSHVSGEGQEDERRSTENIEIQRQRVDLFIDLVWIGVISNISDRFYHQIFAPNANTGHAAFEFILLFLPAWRIWSSLHTFLNVYFLDDFIQRVLIVWVCLLGVVYGNNAPFLLNPNDENSYAGSQNSDYLILTYLVAIVSMEWLELAYAFWITWLRRIMLVGAMVSLPSIGLWIATCLTNHNIQIYLLISAISYDYFLYVFLRSPAGHRLMTTGDFHRAHNLRYGIERFENFFIIALGEGIFLLIRGSPLGSGFSAQLGRGVCAFVIYWLLHYLYFNGDQSKRIIHACYRRWYIAALWQFLHVSMFGTLVILSSGVLYLIDYSPAGETNNVPAGARLVRRGAVPGISTSANTLQTGSAVTCVSVGLILFCELGIAMLNRSRDEPGTLIVDNRYIRLAPRLVASVACCVMWLADFRDPQEVLGLLALIVYVVFLWESFVSMEKGGGLIEPRLPRSSSGASREP